MYDIEKGKKRSNQCRKQGFEQSANSQRKPEQCKDWGLADMFVGGLFLPRC